MLPAKMLGGVSSWLLLFLLSPVPLTLVSSSRAVTSYRNPGSGVVFTQTKTGSQNSGGAISEASRPNQIQCTRGGGYKRYPDPKDEKKFNMCTYSSAHRIWMVFSFNCPAETVFDARSQTCARKDFLGSNRNPIQIAGLLNPYQPQSGYRPGVVVTARPTISSGISSSSSSTSSSISSSSSSIDRKPGNPISPFVSALPTSRPSTTGTRNPVIFNWDYYSTSSPKPRPTYPFRFTPVTIRSNARRTTTTRTTTTTTTTDPPTPATTEEVSASPEEAWTLKSNLTDKIPSSTKHVSVMRDIANKIAYMAQTIETLLTSIESAFNSQNCDKVTAPPSNHTTPTETSANFVTDQITSGQMEAETTEGIKEEDVSGETSEDSSSSYPSVSSSTSTDAHISAENQEQLIPSQQQESTDVSSTIPPTQEPPVWNVILNPTGKPLVPSPPNPASAPPQKMSIENTITTDLAPLKNDLSSKIQSMLQEFFQSGNTSSSGGKNSSSSNSAPTKKNSFLNPSSPSPLMDKEKLAYLSLPLPKKPLVEANAMGEAQSTVESDGSKAKGSHRRPRITFR